MPTEDATLRVLLNTVAHLRALTKQNSLRPWVAPRPIWTHAKEDGLACYPIPLYHMTNIVTKWSKTWVPSIWLRPKRI